MACWLYEGMLMFGVVFISGYLFSTLTQTRHALDNRHMQQAFLFVVFGIYFTWFWAKGQTLAMKTWHIRVVDRCGAALTQPRALLRYTLSWLWFLPPLAVGAVRTARWRTRGDRDRLGGYLGHLVAFPPATPVPARRPRRHAPGAPQTR